MKFIPRTFLRMLLLTAFLASCTAQPERPLEGFQLSEREHLYEKTEWSFVGRVAVASQDNSFTASISWLHEEGLDELELSGPFGQGKTLIIIDGTSVVIDDGDKRVQYFENVDALVAKQLGVFVPVSALKYWVLGLVDPKIDYIEQDQGFVQSEWVVTYLAMQSVGLEWLPRKFRVEREKTKLKLIIDQWNTE